MKKKSAVSWSCHSKKKSWNSSTACYVRNLGNIRSNTGSILESIHILSTHIMHQRLTPPQGWSKKYPMRITIIEHCDRNRSDSPQASIETCRGCTSKPFGPGANVRAQTIAPPQPLRNAKDGTSSYFDGPGRLNWRSWVATLWLRDVNHCQTFDYPCHNLKI